MVVLSPLTSAPAAQPVGAAIRLFLDTPLVGVDRVELAPPQAHYLINVMRRSVGDRLRVFNGRDGEFVASVAEARRRVQLAIGPCLRPQSAEPDIWLAFALLKRGPTELIVQKATELGVARLQPLFTTRTNADRINLARLTAIATEAAEQSERLTVPTLLPPCALGVVLGTWPPDRPLVACLERATDIPFTRGLSGATGILIGPEGGFTDAELDAVRGHPFVRPATLGPRVLRAETAAIVALALLQAG
ncbi:MAG: 16S rRNA (uracil(1498)-N(3))-methyltransferase [Acidocella sp.]|nr:16S rRNA (uracil(1498)-N(3))-methyltransferase [Acidocella sp.]